MKEKLKCSKYIVAYLDILGATDRIKEQEDVFLNEINNILKITSDLKEEKSLSGPIFKDLKFKVFSDNIVFALKFDEHKDEKEKQEQVKGIINLCALLQYRFLEEKMFVRGSITIGNFYISNDNQNEDNNFIYGKALVESYILEKDVAIYPRIILSESIEEYYTYLKGINRIKKCNDSIYCVDFLNANNIHGGKYPKDISKIKENITDELKNKEQQNKEQQKLNWLKNYIEVYEKEQPGE